MNFLAHYTPPTAAQLNDLKQRTALTSNQLAAMADLTIGGHWRRYTGGDEPRPLSLKMHFMLAALMTLTDDELGRVAATMREQGAEVQMLPTRTLRGPLRDLAREG
ncbi:hypothetical protein [Pseudomonas massiliensis]|uniref:hypothetical protein n=1 Tax=Pseudomonas massiliensis TaxID=522492 RepID=UPI000694373C|nr:hypothetical protein [Pseudomonas massiliensis]